MITARLTGAKLAEAALLPASSPGEFGGAVVGVGTVVEVPAVHAVNVSAAGEYGGNQDR